MRLVIWNIRAGGGQRVEAIATQLTRWGADAAALSEFRGTQPSRTLAGALAARGLRHQRTTADVQAPRENALLLASRWPLRRLRLSPEPPEPRRWLLVRVAAPHPFAFGLLHAPNYVTGRKYAFLDAVLAAAQRWRGGPALIGGDTNSTRRDLDEQVPATYMPEEHYIDWLVRAGWADAFRHFHPRRREYTWYSPNAGNGYRLDQAFINRALLPRVCAARHRWGRVGGTDRRDAASDHAALIVDLED